MKLLVILKQFSPGGPPPPPTNGARLWNIKKNEKGDKQKNNLD
jgi:hypothetical protein